MSLSHNKNYGYWRPFVTYLIHIRQLNISNDRIGRSRFFCSKEIYIHEFLLVIYVIMVSHSLVHLSHLKLFAIIDLYLPLPPPIRETAKTCGE